MIKNTSFGTMQTIIERDGIVISELLVFTKKGRSHSHNQWENCFVLQGQGSIIVGDQNIKVTKGSVCKIPPNTAHWMIPTSTLEILLVYSQTEI